VDRLPKVQGRAQNKVLRISHAWAAAITYSICAFYLEANLTLPSPSVIHEHCICDESLAAPYVPESGYRDTISKDFA